MEQRGVRVRTNNFYSRTVTIVSFSERSHKPGRSFQSCSSPLQHPLRGFNTHLPNVASGRNSQLSHKHALEVARSSLPGRQESGARAAGADFPQSKLQLLDGFHRLSLCGGGVPGSATSARGQASIALTTEGVGWLGPQQIDDGSVSALVSLLDVPDQAVRDGVAGALGGLGNRVQSSAAPKLKKLLAEVDCRRANQGSAVVIREALERMGVKAPPEKCATGS